MPSPTQHVVLNLRIQADEGGVRISVKSDINWAPAYGRNPDFLFLGVNCKAFKSNIKDTVNAMATTPHQVVTNRIQPVLFEGTSINATFLQAADIRTGVTFVVPATELAPIGEKQIEEFKKRLAAWADGIFRSMVRSIRKKIVITTTDYEEA